MGLDSVEFVMAIEEAFGLDVPDADAAQLLTPRMLIDYLWGGYRHRTRRAVCHSESSTSVTMHDGR